MTQPLNYKVLIPTLLMGVSTCIFTFGAYSLTYGNGEGLLESWPSEAVQGLGVAIAVVSALVNAAVAYNLINTRLKKMAEDDSKGKREHSWAEWVVGGIALVGSLVFFAYLQKYSVTMLQSSCDHFGWDISDGYIYALAAVFGALPSFLIWGTALWLFNRELVTGQNTASESIQQDLKNRFAKFNNLSISASKRRAALCCGIVFALCGVIGAGIFAVAPGFDPVHQVLTSAHVEESVATPLAWGLVGVGMFNVSLYHSRAAFNAASALFLDDNVDQSGASTPWYRQPWWLAMVVLNAVGAALPAVDGAGNFGDLPGLEWVSFFLTFTASLSATLGWKGQDKSGVAQPVRLSDSPAPNLSSSTQPGSQNN